METPSMDVLCKMYVRVRDKKRALTKEYEEQVAALDESLNTISAAMKDIMVATGTKSMKTDHGTAYITQKVRYYPMDWSAFGQWIVENNAIDLLEKRVAQTNMHTWITDHPTKTPPGLQADPELVVTVRKT